MFLFSLLSMFSALRLKFAFSCCIVFATFSLVHSLNLFVLHEHFGNLKDNILSSFFFKYGSHSFNVDRHFKYLKISF